MKLKKKLKRLSFKRNKAVLWAVSLIPLCEALVHIRKKYGLTIEYEKANSN